METTKTITWRRTPPPPSQTNSCYSLRPVYTERKRNFSFIFAAAGCEQQIGFLKNQSGSNVTFAFAHYTRTLNVMSGLRKGVIVPLWEVSESAVV